MNHNMHIAYCCSITKTVNDIGEIKFAYGRIARVVSIFMIFDYDRYVPRVMIEFPDGKITFVDPQSNEWTYGLKEDLIKKGGTL